MTFWTFILIAIAVALWVSWGLKIHEDPEWFSDFVGSLLKLVRWIIKFIWLPLLAIRLIILWGMRVKDNVDIDKVSSWGVNILMGLFIWILIFWLWLWIYEKFKKIKERSRWKKGFMDMCKELIREQKESRRKEREEKAKKIAKMSEEELKKYKKRKRDRIIIIVALLSPYVLFWLVLLISKIVW